MARTGCKRTIGYLPAVKRFKPAGVHTAGLKEVSLGHDELEAIRLKDLVGLPQEEAARQMDVSQPTFHRLIHSAHKKLAEAIVNGKALKIEGGNISFGRDALPQCGNRREGCDRIRAAGKATDGQRDDSPIVKREETKIAVTSVDGTLDGPVDERFGRSRKFVIYDRETKEWRTMDNFPNTTSAQGSGIQSSRNIIDAGVGVVISSHLGPNAFEALRQAGVDVYSTSGMTVAEAIRAFGEKKLTRLTGPDVKGHWRQDTNQTSTMEET